MNITIFQPPALLTDPDMMSEGGEVEIPRMRNGGFNPASLNLNINDAEIQRQVNESVREYLAQSGGDVPAQIQEAIAALDTVGAQDVQTQISQALSGLPEGITEADVQRIIDANPGLTEDMVLTLIENNQGVGLQDIENAISTAMANVPNAQENEQRLREIAEELFYEDYQRDPFQGDKEGSEQAELEQFIENFLANREGDPALRFADTDIQSLIQQQIDDGLASGNIASGGIAGDITQSLQDMIAEGTLTAEEIQKRIDAWGS
jgi:hypothetical protein